MVAVAGAKPHPPRDLFVNVGLVVVWGVTQEIVFPRDATAATVVPRGSGQGEARGTRVLATEESRRTLSTIHKMMVDTTKPTATTMTDTTTMTATTTPGDGRLLEVQPIGSINLSFFQEDENGEKTTMCVKLTDVPVVESLSFNLFSTYAVSLKQQILHDERGATLQHEQLFAREEKASAAYAMRLPYDPSATTVDCCFARICDCPRFRTSSWFRAFPFPRRGLRGIIGRGIVLTGKLEPCTDCMRAKGRRGSVPRGPGARASKPLGRVHLNLCGPLVPSLGGNLYLFVAVDSASRWNKVYGLRRKSDALAAKKRLLADVGRYDLGRLECFLVDNGT
ncbi:unnamed protein product [Ectocarpus sp. CCAP 1310/34]|nr:unnamed protein product [Ectocarpus sp. CCAP 1310/34]